MVDGVSREDAKARRIFFNRRGAEGAEDGPVGAGPYRRFEKGELVASGEWRVGGKILDV